MPQKFRELYKKVKKKVKLYTFCISIKETKFLQVILIIIHNKTPNMWLQILPAQHSWRKA